MKKTQTKILAIAVIALLTACDNNLPSSNGAGGAHNLSVDEMRRAEIIAGSYYSKDWPTGVEQDGVLVMKKGVFISCRPQDSNRNWLVSCTGSIPRGKGYIERTMYCGYGEGKNAIVACNDKDQK